MKFRNAIHWVLISFFFILFSFLVYNVSHLSINKDMALSSISESLAKSIEENPTNNSIALRNWDIADLKTDTISVISLSTNLINPQADQLLFSKDSKEKLPIASLTKLITAMIAIDNYDLSDEVAFNQSAELIGGSQSVNNLLHSMLIASNNDAAIALAERIGEKNFVWLMNQKVQSIGLVNTAFVDASGLSEENHSTAEDLSKLAVYILKNYPKIVQISEIKEIELPGLEKIENTNKLLGKIPGIIIGKTGFTLDAKECLLLAIYNPKAKNYVINVVLGSNDRFGDMQKLIDWVAYAYSWQK